MRDQSHVWGALPIRFKLLILFAGLSAVPLVIAGTFLGVSLGLNAAQRTESDLDFRLEKARLILDRRWAEVERVTRTVATDNAVVINLSLSLTSAINESLTLLADKQVLDHLVIFDDRGSLIEGRTAGSLPVPTSVPEEGRRFLTSASGPTGKGLVLGAEVPIRTAQGETLGTVIAGVNLIVGPDAGGLAAELHQASGMSVLVVVDGHALGDSGPQAHFPTEDTGKPMGITLSGKTWVFRFIDLSQAGPSRVLLALGLPQAILDTWPLSATLSFLVVILMSLAVSLVLAQAVSRRFTQPISAMADGARQLAEGNFAVEIPETSADEIGALAREFNTMAHRLDHSLTEVHELNENLENRIEERTADLAQANQELEEMVRSLDAARDAMIESEKLAALGHLTTTIAHELNTPLGAIVSSNQTIGTEIRDLLQALPRFLPNLDGPEKVLFDALFHRALEHRTTEASVRADRARRKQWEADLRAAGQPEAERIAEALSEMGFKDLSALPDAPWASPNALEIVLVCEKVFDFARAQDIIAVAATKAAHTVEALLRYNQREDHGETSEIDLTSEIEGCLTLFQGRTKGRVEVVRSYQAVPPIRGRLDALNQVWTNLISNALQAMDYHGILEVAIFPVSEGGVAFSVTDNGPGIPAEHLDKVFRPFFTTKKTGEGTGLGLSISRSVVEAHGGTIDLESRPGHTVFTVRLPDGRPAS